MKPLAEQDFYEMLEVAPGASPQDIERAYQIVRSTYEDNSLAGYSVFDSEAAREISECVEQAYRVLSDAEERAAYDLTLGLAPGLPPEIEPMPAPIAERLVGAAPPAPRVRAPFDDDAADDGEGYDGGWIRRARMRRGIELEQIAETTKVSLTYLRFIEDEAFKELPAEVYVRGFVNAYVTTIGLNPERIVPPYMEKYRAATSEKRKGFLLGGK